MLLKRFSAFLIDYVIVNFLVIQIGILIHLIGFNIDYKNFILIKFSVFFYNYNIGIMSVLSFLISIFFNTFVAKINKGQTIGDKLLNIHITSTKYYGLKLYYLRFFMRTITMFFFHIFLIINIVFLLFKKPISIIWYDDILCIEIKY